MEMALSLIPFRGGAGHGKIGKTLPQINAVGPRLFAAA